MAMMGHMESLVRLNALVLYRDTCEQRRRLAEKAIGASDNEGRHVAIKEWRNLNRAIDAADTTIDGYLAFTPTVGGLH